MKQGTCVICGTTKTQFIKAREGGSLLNKAINNLPFEMHLPGHNFTGPGTNLKKRLNPDLTPKKWSKPVNRVDEAALFRIEKVIKRGKKKSLVKWKGYSDHFNSWVDNKDIVNIS